MLNADSINVNQIIGLLGQGYTLQFPDVLNNLVTLEIAGINLLDRVVIITGPGLDIERVSGFDAMGRPNDTSGLAGEHGIVFETTTDADAMAVQSYFDQYLSGGIVNLAPMSIIVKTQDGITEAFRWNMFKQDPLTMRRA